MKYELTPEEQQEINQELEYNRKVMKAMGFAPERIKQKLKIVRRRVLSRFYNRRQRRKKKIENIQIHRIMKRENSVRDLLDQTFDILFPPEERPDMPPETRLLNAIFGRKTNVPYDAAEEFVRRVTEDAERLVKEYNQEAKAQFNNEEDQ